MSSTNGATRTSIELQSIRSSSQIPGRSSHPTEPEIPTQGAFSQQQIVPALVQHRNGARHPSSTVECERLPPNSSQTLGEKAWKILERTWKSLKSFDRVNIIVGLIISAIVVVPAWRAYVIAQWTARKDFVEYCRINLVISLLGHLLIIG
jgi:hypothetical protein